MKNYLVEKVKIEDPHWETVCLYCGFPLVVGETALYISDQAFCSPSCAISQLRKELDYKENLKELLRKVYQINNTGGPGSRKAVRELLQPYIS